MDAPTTDLAERLVGIGISQSYASQLANSPPRRKPSLKLALEIHEKLGVKLGPLQDVSPKDIPALKKYAGLAA
jgi:transcriptional regulator with XRE-family HTH domain